MLRNNAGGPDPRFGRTRRRAYILQVSFSDGMAYVRRSPYDPSGSLKRASEMSAEKDKKKKKLEREKSVIEYAYRRWVTSTTMTNYEGFRSLESNITDTFFFFFLQGSCQEQKANDQGGFKCPEEFGYYPHPDDCSQYYVCVFGGALLESCTGGLMYRYLYNRLATESSRRFGFGGDHPDGNAF